MHEGKHDGGGGNELVGAFAAVGAEHLIEREDHDGIGGDDNEGGEAEKQDFFDDFFVVAADAQPYFDFFTEQEKDGKQCGEELRNDSGDRRALDAHAESKDKERIERDICHGADADGSHARLSVSLSDDIGVESRRHDGENGADGIPREIVGGVSRDIASRAEQFEEGRFQRKDEGGEQDGHDREQHGAVIQDFSCAFQIALAHFDGHGGGTAQTDPCPEGGKERDDGAADSRPRECEGTHFRHVTYVNAIDDAV